MNIIKQIKIAKKFIKAYTEIKKYFRENHITTETKKVVNDLKSNINRLINIVPEIAQPIINILEIFKND